MNLIFVRFICRSITRWKAQLVIGLNLNLRLMGWFKSWKRHTLFLLIFINIQKFLKICINIMQKFIELYNSIHPSKPSLTKKKYINELFNIAQKSALNLIKLITNLIV
jgi:hypothetical protein